MKQKLHCILLIDDNEASNFLSNLVIEEADCAVNISTQQTAMNALIYIADSAKINGMPNPLPYPDLIFLDINMPFMDGWEFLGQYQKQKNNQQHTPVIIMLSSSFNPQDKLKALSIPEVSGFETKPLTSEMITGIINQYFPEMNTFPVLNETILKFNQTGEL